MPNTGKTLKALTEADVSAKIIIGVVPVTQDYANEISAAGYGVDSVVAVDLAKRLIA